MWAPFVLKDVGLREKVGVSEESLKRWGGGSTVMMVLLLRLVMMMVMAVTQGQSQCDTVADEN